MKKRYQRMMVGCAAASLLFTGCSNNSQGVWDDKSTSYKDKNGNPLWGNSEELAQNDARLAGPMEEEFIPLREEDLKTGFADGAIPQPKDTPGEKGSGLPGINSFQDPAGILASIFPNLYFNTDDHILRGKETLSALDKIASYLKDHPQMYIVIEGHCDERGPEAYNLSLGARRANYIRSMLVQKGVDLNRIHTISFGKEKPLSTGHSQEAWSKNRRAQFKLFNKS